MNNSIILDDVNSTNGGGSVGARGGEFSPPHLSLQERLNRIDLRQIQQKPRGKRFRFTAVTSSRQWDRYFRQNSIYDYERPKKKDGFLDESPEKDPGSFVLRIAKGGKIVEIKKRLGKKPANLGRRKGDIITGYTRESRNRQLKMLLSIDYQKMGAPLFYTLTYPGEYSEDGRKWKNDLRAWEMRMKRRFPEFCGTWDLEPQKRGAPHFAGFLWGCEWLETYEGKKWFSRQWYEVVGSGDERHLKAGTRIDKEQMIETRIFYMAKYLTKAEKGGVKQEFEYPVGRYWGVFGRKRIAITQEDFTIDRNLFFRLRRVMVGYLERRVGKNRFREREAVRGKQNGLWMMMSNVDIERLLKLFVDSDDHVERSGTGFSVF
jgi:hypothetical protein